LSNDLFKLIHHLKNELPICALLDDHEIQKVIPCFELVKYPAGTTIFLEGDPGDFMGFVVSGKIEVKKHTEFKGKQIVLAILGKGSFVGEISTFDHSPRSTTVMALTDSELIILKRETLDSIMQQHPQTGIKILQGIIRILSIRLRKTTERLTKVF
jgi:CRP-like cAMP-binding protein